MSKLELLGKPYWSVAYIGWRSQWRSLSMKSFGYLAKLALLGNRDSERWVKKELLEPGVNQGKNIYRLRTELRESGCKDLASRIESDYNNRYRLKIKNDEIFVHQDMLAYPDAEIAQLVAERIGKNVEAP